jgi:hypothetical protein
MTKQFTLTMAGADGVPEVIDTANGGYSPLDATINSVAKALTVVKFRGTVVFTISTTAGELFFTSVVTFTEDIPTGIWNTTDHHAQ